MKINLKNAEKPFQAFDVTITLESASETSNLIDLFMKDGSTTYRDIARKIMKFSPLDEVTKTEILLEIEGSDVCTVGNAVSLDTTEKPNLYNPDYAVESDYDNSPDDKFQDLTETVREIQSTLSPTLVQSKSPAIQETVNLRNSLFGESKELDSVRMYIVADSVYSLFEATQGTLHHLSNDEVLSLVDNLGSGVLLDVHDPDHAERVLHALRLELAPHLSTEDVVNNLINNHYILPSDISRPDEVNISPEPELIAQVMDQMSRIDVQDTPTIQSALQASKERLESNIIHPDCPDGVDCPDGEGILFK